MALRTAGHIVADQLIAQGITHGFCVPGESYLEVLDGLYERRDDFTLITCRMEAGASNMAVAYGKLTGKPGLCMVTRGPGATHATAGVHTAMQDSVPMILLVGQVGRDMRHREAFQEVDFQAFFGPIAKWAAEIDDPKRVPEYLARAVAVATSGRPGPVVLSLPEDMLVESADVPDARPVHIAQPAPAPCDMEAFVEILNASQKPFVIVGGAWSPKACETLQAICEAKNIPVGAAFRSQDVISNDSLIYVGDVGLGLNPKLKAAIENADLIIALGTRLEENVSGGYTYFEIPNPRQKLVHVHPDVNELGRVYHADVPICATMERFADGLKSIEGKIQAKVVDYVQSLRANYEHWQQPTQVPGKVNMGEVMRYLRENTPQDTIITNGAGNYAIWVHRFLRYRAPRTQLAPTSGAMGFGLPAGVAASILNPQQLVLSFNGDGCFMMCGQELAVAVHYGAKPIVFVVNNGMYGTIRMHQEKHHKNRVSGTDLHNPDFVKLGEAYGCFAARVERTEDFPAIFEAARASGKAALIEIIVDREAITPMAKLSELS